MRYGVAVDGRVDTQAHEVDPPTRPVYCNENMSNRIIA